MDDADDISTGTRIFLIPRTSIRVEVSNFWSGFEQLRLDGVPFRGFALNVSRCTQLV